MRVVFDITAALKLVSRAGKVLKPPEHLDVVADEANNRILECALAAKADLVVTGDKHLLRLGRFREVAIVRLPDFLRLFPGDEPTSAGSRPAFSGRPGGRAR